MTPDEERIVMEKFRRLLALTKSPELEEARTAAFHACQLILKHGLLVQLPGHKASTGSWSKSESKSGPKYESNSEPNSEPKKSTEDWLEQILKEIRRQEQERLRREQQAARAHGHPPWRRPNESRRPPEDSAQFSAVEPRRCEASFRSKCPYCEDFIEKGDPMLWAPGFKATHIECKGYWEKFRPAASQGASSNGSAHRPPVPPKDQDDDLPF